MSRGTVTLVALPFSIQHEADILIDGVLRRALHHQLPVEHEGRTIGEALDQPQIV